jgi:hypothetical protein
MRMRNFYFIGATFILIALYGCNKSSDVKVSTDPSAKIRYVSADLGTQTPSEKELTQIKKQLHFTPQLIRWQVPWEWPFPLKAATLILQKKQIPYIVLDLSAYKDESSLFYTGILDGDWDEYLTKWATEVKNLQYPVLLELDLQDTEVSAKVFNHVVLLFKEQEAHNARWSWKLSSSPAPTSATWLRATAPVSKSNYPRIVDYRQMERVPTVSVTSPHIWLVTPEKVKASLREEDFQGDTEKINLL